MLNLLNEIRACRVCESHLPLGPRPIVQASSTARLLIVSQAPGRRVHQTGIPWNDASGDRLRDWLGLSRKTFYDANVVSLLPMGFCYPGRAQSGDAPPRKECFPLWHDRVHSQLTDIQLTLVVGAYAQNEYLKGRQKFNMTATIRSWSEYLPSQLPLPHPSPRNNLWLLRNPWFLEEAIPEIRRRVAGLLA